MHRKCRRYARTGQYPVIWIHTNLPPTKLLLQPRQCLKSMSSPKQYCSGLTQDITCHLIWPYPRVLLLVIHHNTSDWLTWHLAGGYTVYMGVTRSWPTLSFTTPNLLPTEPQTVLPVFKCCSTSLNLVSVYLAPKGGSTLALHLLFWSSTSFEPLVAEPKTGSDEGSLSTQKTHTRNRRKKWKRRVLSIPSKTDFVFIKYKILTERPCIPFETDYLSLPFTILLFIDYYLLTYFSWLLFIYYFSLSTSHIHQTSLIPKE